MKLLSTDLSPFAARVRTQIRAKSLNIEIVEPDPPLRSEGFLNTYALGKIPILILDDGRYLSESWVIMQYLEDEYPDPSFRPLDNLARSDMGLFHAFADLHLRDKLFPLFLRLMNGTTDDRVEDDIQLIQFELGKFERVLKYQPDFTNREIHIGDIALAMSLYFADATAVVFGESSLLKKTPIVDQWWEWVTGNPHVKLSISEMETAFKEMSNS